MFAGIEGMVVNMAVSFALTELATYGEDTNWALVQTGFDGHLKELIPSPVLEKMAETVVNPTIAAFAKACQDTTDLKVVLTDLENADWPAAAAGFLNLVKTVAPANIAALLPNAA